MPLPALIPIAISAASVVGKIFGASKQKKVEAAIANFDAYQQQKLQEITVKQASDEEKAKLIVAFVEAIENQKSEKKKRDLMFLGLYSAIGVGFMIGMYLILRKPKTPVVVTQ